MDHLKKDDIVSSEEMKVLVVKRKNGTQETYVKVDDPKPLVIGMDHAKTRDYTGFVKSTQRERIADYYDRQFPRPAMLEFTRPGPCEIEFKLSNTTKVDTLANLFTARVTNITSKLTFSELAIGDAFFDKGIEFVKVRAYDERGTERNALEAKTGKAWTVGQFAEVTRPGLTFSDIKPGERFKRTTPGAGETFLKVVPFKKGGSMRNAIKFGEGDTLGFAGRYWTFADTVPVERVID